MGKSQRRAASCGLSLTMDSYHHLLPRLGHTRCYWALLSADLQFIYLDPVLAYHLDAQADLLVGKSLLSFVHPDEQASAKTDLRSVLDSRTLHGSVTRVRFSRLSKVRHQLGYTGPLPQWSDADKISIDANYMAVDIVINWAAEGLVLCFIHATVDLDPQSDNDELHKSHWSNWCGTPWMPPEQIQLLFRRLLICVPQSPSGTNTRVFQILANQPGRQLLLSWPPDQGNGPTGREFSKLVENAEMGSGLQKGNDAKTSCTRRYRATQLMSPSLGEVESIFIPHGTVIFACHKVESSMRSTSTNPANMQHQLAYDTNNGSAYPLPPGPSYYEPPPSYSPLAPTYNQGYLTHQSLPQQPPPSTYSPPRWSQTQQQNYHPTQQPPTQQQWTTPSPTHPGSPLPPAPGPPSSSITASHLRSTSYSNASAPGPSWQTSPGGYEVYRAPSPGYGLYSTASRTSTTTAANPPSTSILPAASTLLNAGTPIQDVVPPPKRRVSPGSARGGDQYNATGASTGRGSGNRPSGVFECSSCGATSSPEWRKGPSGKKELCNACGLRYARSRAKKDGGAAGPGQTRKKKVDKTDDKLNHHHIVGGSGSSNGIDVKREIKHRSRDSASGMTPPLSTIAAAGGSPGYANTMLRRSFGSGSDYGAPKSSPGGSISGSDGGHHGHAHYAVLAAGSGGTGNGSVLTPSPSPPASTSVPSASTSGSLTLPLSGASPTAPASTSTLPQSDSNSDIGFIHYNPPGQQHQHERGDPPISVRPHPHSHHSHSPQTQASHQHLHSPHAHTFSAHPSGPGHYVHTGYTTRPSPLSQAGNIVTGPAAGPLTPLSVPHSATEAGDNGGTVTHSGAGAGVGIGNGMQLPPLAYMDRIVGSNPSNNAHHAHSGSLGSMGGGAKLEYADDGSLGSLSSGGGGGMGVGGGGGGSSVGREPLTPLSAESPIGPGVSGGARNGRRPILGGQ
ncbi:hypothetical protein P691DRAFT_476612 [Macrolepiota fuliginosa MF-IS2]|uniref:GATA-type domain-containing protein n=1 Tax=Macrolepiota fuliginosa MF-IS2 TaxID=1400762 RepID=A0A9P5XG38_9AGAR|nr:hypothetical protein P691DRAFT_476612 [Macrolepiota fuliginosa MF-IS2]